MGAIILTGVALALLGLSIGFRLSARAAVPGRPTIITEFEPPQGLNVMVAAHLVGRSKAAIPAQLVSLATRGNLRVVERPPRGWALQFLTFDGADPMERSLLEALFGVGPAIGDNVELRARDNSLASRVAIISSRAMKEATFRGLRRRPGNGQTIVSIAALALLPILIFSTGPALPLPWLLIPLAAVLSAIAVSLAMMQYTGPLTRDGALLRDHLLGLRDYLELAEGERLRVLHSVQGSERSADRVVRVDEELLPYAVLWGVERSWLRALIGSAGDLDAPPAWLSNPKALAYKGSGRRIRT